MTARQRHHASPVWDTRTPVLVPDISTEDFNWVDSAVCGQVGGDAWFPKKGGSTRQPKKICRSCPVRTDCLEHAMEHDIRFGIWGGLSERERSRLRHQREKEAV